MTEIVDRLAEAICFHMFGPWSAVTEREHGKSKAAAKAALEAIREPNNEMVVAGGQHIPWEQGWGSPDKNTEQVWQAMIDAALAEQPKPQS